MTKNISMSMSEDLLEYIDEKRGDVPRSAFIRKLIKNAINKGGGKQKDA